MKAERKGFNTTVRTDLLRGLKILAAEKDLRINDLLEEAMEDLLKKYEQKPIKPKKITTSLSKRVSK
jgi:antitoxin-like ribbon-helix-helix protein